MDTHAQVELDVFCSLLQTSGLLVGAIGSQVPREPCQAAMLSPVTFWKASGLEIGDFGPVGPAQTRFGGGLRILPRQF